MYRYDEFDAEFVRQRTAQFRDQVDRRLSGELTEDEFKDKFMGSVVRVLGAEQAEELYDASRALADVDDVATLAPLFSRK